MSTLVTGGAGFIGANFVHFWIDRHPKERVVVLDALTYAGNRSNLEPIVGAGRIRFVQGDIGDEALVEQLFSQERVRTVVNFAAETHVDRSIRTPTEFIKTNVHGTCVLLEMARRAWSAKSGIGGHRFHQISTDEVYGSIPEQAAPPNEAALLEPSSPYAASKAAADHLVLAYNQTYGLPVTISRCSNNYGRWQFPEKLIPLCITRALRGELLPIYGDGLQIRDWIHVTDHCYAIEAILGQRQLGQIWNVGGRGGEANLDVVRNLCDLIDLEFARDPKLANKWPRCPSARQSSCRTLIRHVQDRPGHDRRYALDRSKIDRELGIRSTTAIDAGLKQTVRWYLGNPNWWSAHLSAAGTSAENKTQPGPESEPARDRQASS